MYMNENPYLEAADLPKTGSVVYTIIGTEIVQLDNRNKLAVQLQEIHKPFVLNRTNMERIISITDTENINNWIGKKIHLYRDTVEFNGEIVPCIRVKV